MPAEVSPYSGTAPLRLDIAHSTISPALRSASAGGRCAFEIKMALDPHTAHDLENYFASIMQYDPYAAQAADRAYRVTTLYTDTDQFDVLHRTASRKRRKFRLRRYGREACVYLERKSRHQSRVRKKRTVVGAEQTIELAQEATIPTWAGRWFHQSIRRQGLRPVCVIGYRRSALIGASEFGPIRVTFDRDLTAMRTDSWSICGHETVSGSPFSTRTICEFKFPGALPCLFKDVLDRFRFVPGRFSKYRSAAQVLGLATSTVGGEQHA
jgi:hypothetical protein